MANSSKFRADHVGSLLRPQALLEARRRVDAGMIDEEELRIVEDEAIAAAVKLQKDAAIDIFTDGEFRRLDFRTGFVDAFDGVSMEVTRKPWHGENGHEEELVSRQFFIDGRLQQKRRITEGEVAYLRTVTSSPLKVTLIAPGFLIDRFWRDGVTDKHYESRDELAAELASITRAEIEALFEEGVHYVQLDNPGYAAFLNGEGDAEALDLMLRTDAAAAEGVERPRQRSIGLHVCRGNQASLWLREGGYDAIAERLFDLPYDRFLLEYDDERSGGFDPLRLVPEGKMVVLGLVSSKSPQLETLGELQARIDEATAYVDIDFLALSPQCGFASVSDHGNKLSVDDEFKKLQLVSDAALATWGIEL